MPKPSCSPSPGARPGRTAALRRPERAHVVVLPPDELDESNADDFLDRLLAIDGNTDVVVDLRRLVFCGTAGIRALLEADDRLAERDCSLTLSCPPAIVERILAALGLDGRLAVHRPVVRR